MTRPRTGRHAGRRRRAWFGRGRTRAVLSLGIVLALGAVATSASWSDTATVTSGPIGSGTMDLQLQVPRSTTTWELVGTGGSLTDTSLAISDLTPGESQAFNLAARNVGQPTLTYSATVSQASPWSYSGDPIQVRFYAGAVARATNTSAYPRSGSCSGTALGAAVTVTSAPVAVVAARTLVAGAGEQLCVVVSMVTAAANDNQGRTGTLKLDFAAAQVTS